MKDIIPRVAPSGTYLPAEDSAPFPHAAEERWPPGLSRRGLLLGSGLSATAAFLWPAECQAQFDVKPIELPFADQKRATDVLSFFVHWLSLYELAEAYQRRYGELQGEDKAPMAMLAKYLTDTLKAREADVRWVAEIAGGERAQAFEAAASQAIEQAPLRDQEKGELLQAWNASRLKERLAKASDEAQTVVDGVGTALRSATEKTGIPKVAEADKELLERWLCAVLQSMLASALAAGQWYAVATITLRMRSNGCLVQR